MSAIADSADHPTQCEKGNTVIGLIAALTLQMNLLYVHGQVRVTYLKHEESYIHSKCQNDQPTYFTSKL